MGDHGQTGPHGYIVRIETKQGCVYRPKTVSQALEQQQQQRTIAAGQGQHRRYRFPVAPHMVVQTVSSSVQSFPQGKSKARLGGSAAGPAHPRIGDDSIELGIDLARSDVPLPGEYRVAAAPLFASEADQDAELYRRGILYHDDDVATNEAEMIPAVTATTTATTATATTTTTTSPAAYQVDSLDGIRHGQPAYTVRLVDGKNAKKRKGKRAGADAAEAEAEAAVDVVTDADTDTARLIRELPVPEGLRLFTLGNLWEQERPGAAGDAADRLLGHADIDLDDIENVEYVLVDDDDLHSMAASWVELDSVAASDDWT